MPTYLSPGVYVEEVDTGPQPIQGVSTSITGAVGVTAFGPSSGKPVLVTSFAEFLGRFGGFLPDPPSAVYNFWALDGVEGGEWWHFPLAVKGYFDNGGQQLYVKRVSAKTAVAASASLGQGLIAGVAADAAVNATGVKLSHLINIFEGVKLQLFRGDTNAQIGGNFTVVAYDGSSGQVTVDLAFPTALISKRGDYAQIYSIKPAAANPTLTFTAKALGQWGNALSVMVRPTVGSTMSIAFDPTIAGNNTASTTVVKTVNPGPLAKTTVTVASAAGFANGDHISVLGQEYAIGNVTPGPPATFDITPPLAPGQNWAAGTGVKRLRVANTANASQTINVWTAPSLYIGAIVELDNGHLKETFTVKSIAGNLVTLDTVRGNKNIQNTYYEGQKLNVVEAAVDISYTPADGNSAFESFSNLRLVNDGTVNYLPNRVNQQSMLVTVAAPGLSSTDDLAAFPTAAQGGAQALTQGDDKLADLTIDDFVGVDKGSGARTGIQALEDVTDVSLCVVPGMWSRTIQSALITHCESLRYRFAILDSGKNLGIDDVLAFRAPLDSKFAALYYPWIDVRDASVSRNVSIAPSGHIAGIYARVDNDRGVYKAPANEEILSIFDISQDVNKREQELLNPVGINALRFFPQRGNRVWGARTLSSESAWKYVNVKRIFIYVEASIDYGTQWVVFEPNDEPLWARVRQTISDFLATTWRSGALQGTKPSEAFFVKCDRTTMTQDDIDNGRLICIIGIAPVKPAEFVIFRIQQFTQATTAAG
ncbi:phage tail sheath family protein [Paraburkholderia sp. BR14374]|uniref:phage tail sheath family protein n=1 Tax=Paraburkholderia sp. BR14374 TaxID=3237007 RepID=UPI0034CFCDD4